MNFNQLIFSDQTAHRATRHLLFWILFCTDFLIQVITPYVLSDLIHWNIYKQALINLCCYFPIGVFSVYASIYYLAPQFFYNKKYLRFAIGLLLLFSIDLGLSYYATGVFLKLINFDAKLTTFLHKIDFAYLFNILILTITVVAIGIKITRRWYLQQKENVEISKQKARMELQLKKTNIQPGFVFETLSNIRKEVSLQNDDKAGEMVLKLSDILSYSLYESDLELVPLDMELSFLNEFIALHNVTGNEIKIKKHLPDATHNLYLTPMTLLSFVQECIGTESTEKQYSYSISIYTSATNEKLFIRLPVIDILPDTSKAKQHYVASTINHFDKLYRSSGYEIQTTLEDNITMATLSVPLICDPQTDSSVLILNTSAHEFA